MRKTNLFRDWTVFGPIPNPGPFPGETGWKELAVDAVTGVPAMIEVNGQTYGPVRHRAGADVCSLDFRKVFGVRLDGSPMCFAFCEFTVRKAQSILLGCDADWGVVIRLDGREVLHSREGNGWPGSFSRRARVNLTAGKHILACRVISGSGGWKLDFLVRDLPAEPDSVPLYSDTGLRIEERPLPTGQIGEFSMAAYEKTLAACGVEARWISVCDQEHVRLTGNAVYKSPFLPIGEHYRDDFEDNLKKWVKQIHDLGLPVLSWFPMTQCRQGWLDHPEWRQKYLVEPGPDSDNKGMACCVHSPFGEAVARFCAEAVGKFDLDGIWFDGSAFTPIWEITQPVGCLCDYCREKYKKETGAELPAAFAPETLEFRKWMLWRYKAFGEYIRYVTDEIKKVKATAQVAVNHYHRHNIGWNGAIPLNPFSADIIAGTEADGDPWKAAFYTRVMRAYGRPFSEVWLSASVGTYKVDDRWYHNPRGLITHAVACLTAGGNPSFGGCTPAVSAATLTKLAEEIRIRKPYRYLPSRPYAAMLVSQQTDTFTFGVNPDFITQKWTDYYWRSLCGWDRLLLQSGVWTDVIFDDHLKKDCLKKYKILFLPFAVALSDGQIRVLLDYVHGGGILVAGPFFGAQDEWGFVRIRSAGVDILFPNRPKFPEFSNLATFFKEGGSKFTAAKFGKGQVVQFTSDLGGQFHDDPSQNAIQTIWKLVGRDSGGIPIVFESPKGKPVYAHLGVFQRKKETLVAIQQVPPFWTSSDPSLEAPPTVSGCSLKINLPGVRRAESMLSDPPVELVMVRKGKTLEVQLPPFNWGLVVKLT